MLSRYIPYLPLRLSTLLHYLVGSLSEVTHDVTCTPVARVLSRIPGQRLSAVGEQCETGSTVSLIFLEVSKTASPSVISNKIDLEQPSGEMTPNSFIEYAAMKYKISLRTGCMCNPGGVAAMLGTGGDAGRFSLGTTRADIETAMGREIGVVRLSLGLASDFSDVHRLLRFIRGVVACDSKRKKVWLEWKSCTQGAHD